MTFPEIVTQFNIEKMQELVQWGELLQKEAVGIPASRVRG
jgi:hypothetical protein